MNTIPSLTDAVLEAQRQRIAKLRILPVEEIARQPACSSEVVLIQNKKISFTTFIEPQSDGRFLILVRSDRPSFLGFVTYGTTEGFWMSYDGTISETSDKDVLDYFG